MTDTDLMPFGKYKGIPMSDVPASYFHWLWCKGMSADIIGDVACYIRKNLEVLRREYPDGIWK